MGRVNVALRGRRQGRTGIPACYTHQQALVSITALLHVLTDDPALSAARINGNGQERLGQGMAGTGRL